jgi:transposase
LYPLSKKAEARERHNRYLKFPAILLYRWLNSEDLKPKAHGLRQRKLDRTLLKQHVQKYPDAKLSERAIHFGVRPSAIWYSLRTMKIVKKARRYSERCNMQRANYLSQLRSFFKSHGKETSFTLMKAALRNTVTALTGWALRGQKVYGDVSGNNRKDVNLIMAQRRDQWLAPVVFKGTCNTELVNTWIKDFLLKELHHPSVIVMDNARFHKKSEIKLILEKHGHTLLPLPKYSPDF